MKGSLHSFNKKRVLEPQIIEEPKTPNTTNLEILVEPENHSCQSSRVESSEIDISSLESEHGLRRPIFEYLHTLQDEIRCAYIKFGIETIFFR